MFLCLFSFSFHSWMISFYFILMSYSFWFWGIYCLFLTCACLIFQVYKPLPISVCFSLLYRLKHIFQNENLDFLLFFPTFYDFDVLFFHIFMFFILFLLVFTIVFRYVIFLFLFHMLAF